MGVAACASPIAVAKKKDGTGGGTPSPSLLLVAHGSRLGADPAVAKLMTVLSADFGEVAFAVVHGRPNPHEVLTGMTGSPVHVVPLLIACGDVSGSLFASLSRLTAVARSRLRVHPPIGAHPRLAALICERIGRIIDECQLAPRNTAVVLVGHGSGRNPVSGSAIRRIASLVRAQACEAAEVHCAFLSEAPLVQDWQTLTRCKNVIAVPCLLTTGIHLRFDLPELLRVEETCRAGIVGARRLFVAPHLTADTHGLAALVRDTVFGRDAVFGRFPASVGAAA